MERSLASDDTHTASSNKSAIKIKNTGHTHTYIHRRFCTIPSTGGRGWGGLRRHSCLPQQGLFRGRRRVTIVALRRLLGHLLINVPGCHPEPQHGRQGRVMQHDPDLTQGDRRYIKLCLWLFWTFAYTYCTACLSKKKKNVRLHYIPVTQRKDVQEELPLLSQKHHQCHSKGVSIDDFLLDPTALSYPPLKDNNTRMERRVQKVLLNHQGCLG